MPSRRDRRQPPLPPAPPYRERTYRRVVSTPLLTQQITVQQTDIHIYSKVPVAQAAKDIIINQRSLIEKYIRAHPGFLETLTPWTADRPAAAVVRAMIRAGQLAGVGPMAAVAGAIAEQVGQQLAAVSDELIVENGGDIYFHTTRALTVAVFAGRSPLSMKIGLRIADPGAAQALCTSSGTVGHSLSLGCADAVSVLGTSCPLADAVATAVGNRVRRAADIESAVAWGRSIEGVTGLLVIKGAEIGAWGCVEIIAL